MHTNKLKFGLVLASALVLWGPAALAAGGNAMAKKDPVTINMHGFISAAWFGQDSQFGYFGNGANAELPTGSSHNLSGVDARNTRLWWTIEGPALSNGWSTSGRLEADFFGGFNGDSAFSSTQETPRLRQAYFELTSPDGRTSVTIGQQWDLIFPIKSVPKSMTHIAFPLGFGVGMIGWRYPGVVWHQALSRSMSTGPRVGLDVGVFSGNWTGPGSSNDFNTPGNVGFRPQVEARVNVAQGSWDAYAVGHYSSENLQGVTGSGPSNTITSWAAELGTAWHPGPWSLVGAVYSGKAIGQLFGSMTQFGDIKDNGGYVQGGYSFMPHWGVYASYAIDKPNTSDVVSQLGTGRVKGQQGAVDLVYTDGPIGFGVEWMHGVLREATSPTGRQTNVGNQVSVGGIYHF
ncbi:MAG TPA: hypothetical protein VFA86_11880 [Gammaproteobacteria bacterium]|nr:hypothetical protein [Gammaproteobacteria bacterium]